MGPTQGRARGPGRPARVVVAEGQRRWRLNWFLLCSCYCPTLLPILEANLPPAGPHKDPAGDGRPNCTTAKKS